MKTLKTPTPRAAMSGDPPGSVQQSPRHNRNCQKAARALGHTDWAACAPNMSPASPINTCAPECPCQAWRFSSAMLALPLLQHTRAHDSCCLQARWAFAQVRRVHDRNGQESRSRVGGAQSLAARKRASQSGARHSCKELSIHETQPRTKPRLSLQRMHWKQLRPCIGCLRT